jgi:hypothetical protein
VGQHARIQNQPPQPKGKKPWVNIPEWWVNIKQNGGSTWSRTYSQIDDWKAKRFDHDEEFFLDLVPLGPNSFFVKSLSAETKESVLGKIFTDSPYYYFDSSLLERQVDGVFCTDGIMLHNEEFNRLIYVYRYRNQFLLMDTSLHNIGIGNTIDTVTRAKVKVRAIDSGKTKTLAVPPPAVNNTAATYSHWLFVNSHLLAQNEHPKAHAEASVIDVYDLTSRAYLFSFYVRSPTKSQSLREFVVRNNILISLFIDQVRIYDLNPAFFQTNKDNYARINRKVGRTPV